jgi:hypothetical protein
MCSISCSTIDDCILALRCAVSLLLLLLLDATEDTVQVWLKEG